MIIVILGAGINEKGILSGETIKRLLEGYKVYKKKKAPFLLSGKYSFLYKKKPFFTEAERMKEYLLSLGVEEKDISLDMESEDTLFAAYNAKTKFFLPQDEKRAVIVTSDISLNRVEYVFFKVFGEKYNLHFIATTSKLPCTIKGMVLEKQRLLNEKAKVLLDDIEEGNHEKVKEKALSSERGVILTKDIKYRKTC